MLAAACRTAVPENLSSRDVATTTPATGGVAVKLVADPTAPSVQLGPGEEYVEPQLNRSNPLPVYPAELVALHLPPHVVVLRVYFDKQGDAIDVRPSPVAASTDDQYREAFEQAARQSLKKWRCYAAAIRKFRPGPDTDGDGKPDYRILEAQRYFSTFFDVSFSFEIVNGEPVVKPK